jgi:hypothetical protein
MCIYVLKNGLSLNPNFGEVYNNMADQMLMDMHAYVYSCVCVCVYVFICVFMCAYMCVYVYNNIANYMCDRIYVCVWV